MIIIGLGSNIGQKEENIHRSIELITQAGVEVVNLSSLYASEPWGILRQASFVNAIAEVHFEGTAIELLDILLETEIDMGRKRIFKWGPRLIDLDIIEFRAQRIHTDRLQIPHPYYRERNFVLIPLEELYPEFIPSFPEEKKAVKELITEEMRRGIAKIG